MTSYADAFSSAECPPPGGFLAEGASGIEAEQLRELLATTAPADLTASQVRSAVQGNLWMLSPQGFRCLLPAVMRLAMDRYDALGIFVAELVQALTRPDRADVEQALDRLAQIPPGLGPEPDTLRQLRRQQFEWYDSGLPAATYRVRLAALSVPERDAVLRFLTTLRNEHGDDFPLHELDSAIQRHSRPED